MHVRLVAALALALCRAGLRAGQAYAVPGVARRSATRFPIRRGSSPPPFRWIRRIAGRAGRGRRDGAARRASDSRTCVRHPRGPGDPRVYAVAGARHGAPAGRPVAAAGPGHALARGHRHRRAWTRGRCSRWAASPCRGASSRRPATSPSITTDEPDRLAAVVSDDASRVMHNYLLADPASSTLVELATVDHPAVAGALAVRCPTRRSSTRWRRRCAPPTWVRAGERDAGCRRR